VPGGDDEDMAHSPAQREWAIPAADLDLQALPGLAQLAFDRRLRAAISFFLRRTLGFS
jgi:hypothetical protein